MIRQNKKKLKNMPENGTEDDKRRYERQADDDDTGYQRRRSTNFEKDQNQILKEKAKGRNAESAPPYS